MLTILDDTGTLIKAFTYDTNTVNVEYLINKELHMVRTTYIIVKI